MEVRCPQCHSPVDLAGDTSLSDIACPSCGGSFSLLGEETMTYQAAETKTIGHFELVDQIGVGSFGSVWRARDTELDRTVAVKIPRKGQLDAEESEQFLREARAVAQLRHPNIVGVHEVGREDDTVFIVSDFVEGLTLADWLTGQRLSSREAAGLCAKIADALDHAHEAGVVHRDLKPGNIILDAGGEPHVTDFGLARREVGEVTMTVEGKVLGTPAYMSPEQAKGEAHHADRRSDVYSLGVILFELLTGEKPFRGNVRMLLHQVIHEEAPSPRKLNGNVPRDLETVCLKCLEKEPQRRYATAADVAKELRRYLNGEPIDARPLSTFGRAWRWGKRRPALAGSLSMATILLLFVAIAAPIAALRESVLREAAQLGERQATAAAVRAAEAGEAAKQESERRRRLLYVSDMVSAQQAWEAGSVAGTLELLARHQPKDDEKDLRGFQWRYLWEHCQRSLHTTTLEHGGAVWGIAFSPDGKTLASAGIDQPVKLWDVETGQQRQTIGKPGKMLAVAFSSDGKTLASGSAFGGLTLLNLATGNETARVPDYWPLRMASSPDDAILATVGFDTTVWLRDMATGKTRKTLKKHTTNPVWSAAFSADGRLLASGSEREVILWDMESEAEPHVFKEDVACGYCVAFTADGKTLASGGVDGSVWLWDTERRCRKAVLQGQTGAVIFSLAISSDGKLAAGSYDGTVTLWDFNTQAEDVFKGHEHMIYGLAFSPDESVLASASWDGTVRLWDVTACRPPDVLGAHTSSVTAVAFSPDGSIVASGASDHSVRIWDVQSGSELRMLPAHEAGVAAVAISLDGRLLASAGWDHKVKLWDLTTGEPRASFDNPTPYSVAFSPDGEILASGNRSVRACVWDLATRRLRPPPLATHGNGVTDAVISPNGEILATASCDKTVKLWDLASGTQLHLLLGHQADVGCVVFSPDGRTVVSASVDCTVKLWDVETGTELKTLRGHTAAVNSVAFSPDGRIVASGGNDRTVRLWYLGTTKEPEILAHQASVRSVAFSPMGDVLASTSGKNVRLWRTSGDGISPETEALVSLEHRASTIAEADTEEQRRTLDDLKAHLLASAAKGLLQRDAVLVTSTARRLEDCGQPELAGEAIRSFGEAIGDSKDPRFAELANVWESAFHERCGRRALEAGQLDQAIHHFTGALAVTPDDPQLLTARGQLHVRLGQWREAAADYKKLVELTPANAIAWLRAAPLFVLADDLEGYRGHCRGMVARFGASDELSLADRTIKACVLLPDAVADLGPLLSRLQNALDDGSAPDWLGKWGYMALAMAAHRAENAELALEHIAKSRQSPGYEETEPAAAILLCLTAMSQLRLGEPEKARHSLRQAGDLIDEHFSGLTTGEVAVAHDWLIAEILRREAAVLINGPTKDPTPQPGAAATYVPKDLLDFLVDSYHNGGRLEGTLASSPRMTATDNSLMKVSLSLLTEEVLQYPGFTDGVSVCQQVRVLARLPSDHGGRTWNSMPFPRRKDDMVPTSLVPFSYAGRSCFWSLPCTCPSGPTCSWA